MRPNLPEPDSVATRTADWSADWSLFDAVYIVSVYGAEERLERTVRRAEAVGIPEGRIRVIRDAPRRNRTTAIWNNHRRAWFDLLEHGFRLAVLFEDDMVANADVSSSQADGAFGWLAEHVEQVDVFYLGHWPFTNLRPVHPNVVQTSSHLAHAYAFTSAFAARWAPVLPFRGRGLDDGLLCRLPRQYAAYPMLFHQDDLRSSRSGRTHIYNVPGANALVEREAFAGRLWPNPRALGSYAKLLRYGRGRINPLAEIRRVLLHDLPWMAIDAVRSRTGARPEV